MPTVSHLSALARRSINARSPAEAIGLAWHILRYYPKSIEAHCLLGEAYMVSGEAGKSGEYFRLVLSADPENVTALAGLGAAYREEGRPGEALSQLERAFDLQPDNPRLRREVLGISRLADGTERDRLKPTRGALAWTYLRSGLYARAVKEFRAISAADPDRLDALAGLAEALWRAKLYGDAAVVCKRLLDLAPDCLKAKLLLADMSLVGKVQVDHESLRAEAYGLDPDDQMASSLFAGTAAAPRWPVAPADLPPMAEK